MDIPSTELPKSSIPYTKGWKFTVNSHIPPRPTLVTKNCCRNFEVGRNERSQFSPAQRCLRNPPLLGEQGSHILNLEVLELLKVGDGCNAQVFTVRVDNPECTESNANLVAKIYDPLYFDDEEGYLNPFLCVDKHYTHEVHAYGVLSDLQGVLVPRFYGSYSLDLLVEDSAKRTVRLILIEYLPGISMQQAIPKDFPQRTRQQIMKSVIEFESEVYKRDILLTDLHPRNVMMVDQGQRKLVFYDFAGALFGRRRDDPIAVEFNLFLGQYISPLLRWDTTMAMEFGEWIDWDWDSWVKEEFAHTSANITQEMREMYC
ncbi:uncharacterized protein ACLA_059260 [Aspergillus clavatus NRRL 1]|uniref:Protein kinase domain-containing protein n=1 Tax=Aspergillus clavatus (strain ATCC 1007 / CBS 513.65 / DSM 816 / NCTC 3887 / NRRL 1 / QM 1276 / 107) TaxID=344612 RepID=A1C4C2_ASPCL|nr:uncharacterized protein ACLA_059260 [Aspergillus clavatus NRRL 1]EAW15262.1 conserved hypothetical protein [Aspergillus clavatus NRRL 1]